MYPYYVHPDVREICKIHLSMAAGDSTKLKTPVCDPHVNLHATRHWRDNDLTYPKNKTR